jgi:hypothetical protein
MAFTDFTPQVNMAGSAYSTATGKYSQTVTSDTAVYLLEDFTNATSHMNVTLGTTDETYFSVSQFQQVGGLASNSPTAEPIGVGPNANGSQVGDAWTLGFNADVNGQYAIYQRKNSNWVEQPGRATHIAVGPEGSLGRQLSGIDLLLGRELVRTCPEPKHYLCVVDQRRSQCLRLLLRRPVDPRLPRGNGRL